jgi:methionine-rich copper-binding protein CopC
VRDGSGRQVDRHDLHADKTEPTLLHLSLGDGLGPGTYKVNWTAVAQDMHPSRGSLRFQVSPNEKR